MSRQVFFLDLISEDLAGQYEDFHRPGNVPSEVIGDIVGSGITGMQIFRLADRLVMITDAGDGIDAHERVASDASTLWETQMDLFQRPIEAEPSSAKWKPGKLIFDLNDHFPKEASR